MLYYITYPRNQFGARYLRQVILWSQRPDFRTGDIDRIIVLTQLVNFYLILFIILVYVISGKNKSNAIFKGQII